MSHKEPGRRSGRPPKVIVYSGGDISTAENAVYFLNLFWKLMAAGRERGWEIIPVTERRAFSETITEPQEITDLMEQGEIDGLVGFILSESMVRWIEELGIPFVTLGAGTEAHNLNYDMRGMIDSSFARFAELCCRSAGMIIPSGLGNADVLEYIDEAARKQKVEINYEWILVSRKAWDLNGYNHFRSFWEMKNRPEGLLVYPDVTAHGVVTAALELKAAIPRDLKLILHRNKEMYYNIPMVCDWVESGAGEMAEALLQQLSAHMEKEPLKKIHVPLRMIKGY